MTSVHSSSLDADEVDLSGLVESVVDSDEEDLAESIEVSLANTRIQFHKYPNGNFIRYTFHSEFNCS